MAKRPFRMFVDVAPLEIVLYTDKECRNLLKEMQTKPECTRVMTFQNYGNLPDDQQTPGSTAFLHSQVVYPDAQGTPVNEYWELDGETGIGSRLSARHMARIISYMKVNGGYTIVQTQELGNCLYASILRGTDIRKEFTTMHLRRMLMVLPGPFCLKTFCEHLLTNGTWGDDLILTLVSCMWQISGTSVNATTLGETRIRHNLPLEKADLVVIFAMGDHFMGSGE